MHETLIWKVFIFPMELFNHIWRIPRRFQSIFHFIHRNYTQLCISERPSGRSCEDNWWRKVLKIHRKVFLYISSLFLNFTPQLFDLGIILLLWVKFISRINLIPQQTKLFLRLGSLAYWLKNHIFAEITHLVSLIASVNSRFNWRWPPFAVQM